MIWTLAAAHFAFVFGAILSGPLLITIIVAAIFEASYARTVTTAFWVDLVITALSAAWLTTYYSSLWSM